MGMALLVAGPGTGEPSMGAEAAGRLAELGVTRVALLQDGGGLGVVLEGWAFDGAQAEEAARVVFPGDSDVRVLREAASVAVSTRGHQGGTR